MDQASRKKMADALREQTEAAVKFFGPLQGVCPADEAPSEAVVTAGGEPETPPTNGSGSLYQRVKKFIKKRKKGRASKSG